MRLRYFISLVFIILLINLSSAYCFEYSAVKHQWDIFYTAEKDSLQSVDVYWNELSENANVIFFVHGGGWLSGDKKTYRDMAISLASQGFTVVLANYRLSPKVKFPAHVEDVAAAIGWVNSTIKKYNGDPEKIYLMGHSAGGHLITLAVSDEKYLKQHDLNADVIAGLITISGVFEIKIQEGGATKKFLGMVFGDNEEVWAEATCQNHIAQSKNNLPPFLIVWGEGEEDMIKNESLNIIETLKDAGLEYHSFVFEGNDHNAFISTLKDNESSFSKKVVEFIDISQRQN